MTAVRSSSAGGDTCAEKLTVYLEPQSLLALLQHVLSASTSPAPPSKRVRPGLPPCLVPFHENLGLHW